MNPDVLRPYPPEIQYATEITPDQESRLNDWLQTLYSDLQITIAKPFSESRAGTQPRRTVIIETKDGQKPRGQFFVLIQHLNSQSKFLDAVAKALKYPYEHF